MSVELCQYETVQNDTLFNMLEKTVQINLPSSETGVNVGVRN